MSQDFLNDHFHSARGRWPQLSGSNEPVVAIE